MSRRGPSTTAVEELLALPQGHPFRTVAEGMYRPHGIDDDFQWHLARPLLLSILAANRDAIPATPSTLRPLRSSLGRYLYWLAGDNPDQLEPESALDEVQIERFIHSAASAHLLGPTKYVERGQIRRFRRGYPALFPLIEEEPWLSEAPPATDREFAVAWDAVGTVRSEKSRRFLQAQLLLSRGAGLGSADIRSLAGGAVFRRPGAGLWVRVERPGPSRKVPVLWRFADDLEQLAIQAGHGCLIADSLPPAPPWRNKQLTRDLDRRLRPVRGASAPNPGRLRRAWLVEQLTLGTPIPTLLCMAGLRSFRALTGLIQYASDPVMSVEEMAVRMGGVEPPGRGERG
ncbi:MAG: hypothetical protein WBU92_07735 [Candidatus Dormiibacterota bacterium]